MSQISIKSIKRKYDGRGLPIYHRAAQHLPPTYNVTKEIGEYHSVYLPGRPGGSACHIVEVSVM